MGKSCLILILLLIACSKKGNTTGLLKEPAKEGTVSMDSQEKKANDKKNTGIKIKTKKNKDIVLKSPLGTYMMYLSKSEDSDPYNVTNFTYKVLIKNSETGKVIYDNYQMAEEVLWHDDKTIKILQASRDLKNEIYLDVVKGEIVKTQEMNKKLN